MVSRISKSRSRRNANRWNRNREWGINATVPISQLFSLSIRWPWTCHCATLSKEGFSRFRGYETFAFAFNRVPLPACPSLDTRTKENERSKTKEGREAERIEKANKPSPQYFLIILSVRDSGSTIAIPVERPITRKLMSVPLRKLLRTLGYLNFFTSLYIYQGGLKDFDITRIFQMWKEVFFTLNDIYIYIYIYK